MKKRWFSAFLALVLLLGMACGCAAAPEEDAELATLGEITDESIPLGGMPPIGIVLNPMASGTATAKNDAAVIDYSNAADGYVMVKWTGGGNPRIKVQIKGPNCPDKYKYNLRTDGEYDVFPLSDGNGTYRISVHKNMYDDQYSDVLAAKVDAKLTDEFAPFIRPNQYVNYSDDSEAVAMAAQLIADAGIEDNLSKVGVIYEWVVTNLKYDTAKANQVKKGELTGYLPDVDSVMNEKKGICFDYAALMSAMLRSQGVPIKLVVGYTSTGVYHAWINVWSEEGGWVESMIYFDGKIWNLMDPTFASSGKQSKGIMDFINTPGNYKEKYLY